MMSGEGKIAFKQTKDPFAKYAQGPLKGKTRRSSQEHPQAAIGIGVALDAPGSEAPVDVEKLLKAFDLTGKYGPCTGLPRLERWERAEKLGLNPPLEVKELLLSLPAEDALQQNIWEGRV